MEIHTSVTSKAIFTVLNFTGKTWHKMCIRDRLWIQYTLDANSAADEFNIIVVYECTPVLYDDNGNPYADWDNAVVLDDSTETVTDPDTGADTGTEQEGE